MTVEIEAREAILTMLAPWVLFEQGMCFACHHHHGFQFYIQKALPEGVVHLDQIPPLNECSGEVNQNINMSQKISTFASTHH